VRWGMRVFRWGILIPNSALTMLSVSTSRNPHPARAWGKRSAGSDKSGRRDGLPLAFNHAGRSQLCHAIPEPGGHGRTREDTTSSAIQYRRTRKEPPGYGRTHTVVRVGTVRPRVQIPGPRPSQTKGPLLELAHSVRSSVSRASFAGGPVAFVCPHRGKVGEHCQRRPESPVAVLESLLVDMVHATSERFARSQWGCCTGRRCRQPRTAIYLYSSLHRCKSPTDRLEDQSATNSCSHAS